MKAAHPRILLEPTESFTCVEWKAPLTQPHLIVLEEYLLKLMVGGRGLRFIGNSVERFQDGDLALLGPNIPNYWLRDARDLAVHKTHVSATFDKIFLDGSPFRSPEAAPVRRLLSRARRGVLFSHRAYTEITPDLLRATRLKGWARLCLFLDILGRLATDSGMRFLASENFSSQLDRSDAGRLSAVCQYVHASYGTEIREKKAAAVAGLSPVGFSRFFHRRMGTTFVAYVTDVRINEACRKLMEGDSPIVEIAFETGFNTLSNFNRHFRRLQGMTPREYRRLHSEH